MKIFKLVYVIVLYYILFRERIKAVERHPEIGKSSAKYFNGNTLILPKRLTILDLNYGWFKFKFWLKITGLTLNSIFYLDLYIPFLFWLLYPFSIWTFISLFYLESNFPFLFISLPFVFLLLVFYFEFYFSIWILKAALSRIKRIKNVSSILAEFEIEPSLN